MPQISFTKDRAQQALAEFLDGERQPDGRPYDRTILSEDGTTAIAEIVDAEHYNNLLNGYRQWQESQEIHGDADLPPGYRPFRHSPTATPERLMPTEPLHEPLARYIFGKGYDELEQREQDRVFGAALMCLLNTTLDADSTGAVPVLMLGHDHDAPDSRLLWHLAYVTDTPGLFLRATGNGFFGEEWGIVTGSGYKITGGYLSREGAAWAVAALARTLPKVEWMRMTPDNLTDTAMAAIRKVLAKYHPFGERDEQPEPEVVEDSLTAPEVTV